MPMRRTELTISLKTHCACRQQIIVVCWKTCLFPMFSNNFDKRFRKQSLPPPPQPHPSFLQKYFFYVEKNFYFPISPKTLIKDFPKKRSPPPPSSLPLHFAQILFGCGNNIKRVLQSVEYQIIYLSALN